MPSGASRPMVVTADDPVSAHFFVTVTFTQ